MPTQTIRCSCHSVPTWMYWYCTRVVSVTGGGPGSVVVHASCSALVPDRSSPLHVVVHGAAAGIGLSLVAFCDLRFAASGTKFTTAHGKLGLPAEYGLSWILPKIVGTTRAMELLLTSRVFLAEEALDIGFLNNVFPEDELLPRVLDYAEALASSVAPSSLRETRRQVYLDMHRPVGDSITESLRLLNEMMGTDEYRQGVKALVEKRPPGF